MPQQPRHIRIFLSSPGDVDDERAIARKVVEDLLYDPVFSEEVTIRVIAWDKRSGVTPMLATMTPQMAITAGMPKPSDCDIVIVILWSRMGTPLPEEYVKEDGTPYLSGTEWEFEDAFRAAKRSGSPDILVYRREDAVLLNPSDPEFTKKYEQWKRLEHFFASFSAPSTNAINRGYNSFVTPDDFRRQLESHLRTVIRRLVQTSPVAPPPASRASAQVEAGAPKPVWQGSPFPGLKAFTEADAPIFFGRGRESDDLLKQVRNSRFVAVVGVSGSGKSSLVMAGLIPRLRSNAVADMGQSSKDWHIVRFTPNNDPFLQLSGALLKSIPGLKGDPVEYSTRRTKLASALRQSPTALWETLESVFPEDSHATEAFVFLDQFEELFTLTPPELRQPFVDMLAQSVQRSALASLRQGAASAKDRIRIVATLRADFYHRCVEYPALAELLRSGSFPLAAPSQTALGEMITRPAERAMLLFEADLPGRILKDTGDEPGALALLAFTLDELYHAGKDKKCLTHLDYDSLGGVRGAIGRRAEAIFDKLPDDAKATLPSIFQHLVAVDHQGTATRERAEFSEIARSDEEKRLIEAFTESRLLVQSRGERGPVTEVAHEALFTSWGRLADWIEETRHDLYLIRQMRRAAAVWEKRARHRDFLWLGERGQELQQVLQRLHPHLSESERTFSRPEQEHLVEELEIPATSNSRRSEIGLRLHIVKDLRPGVGSRSDGYPDIVWKRIPAGDVCIGDKLFAVKAFYFAKYPITYSQFQRFLEDKDGWDRDEWWLGLPEKFRKQRMREQHFKFANHPRDDVSWYQAVAFTHWLAAKLPDDGYPEGVSAMGIGAENTWTIRLPTEWEWQHAATLGNPENVYPWGSKWAELRSNTQETGLGRTVAVGMYPAGISPTGIMDMGGNIREWCLNEYRQIERVSLDSTRSRSLRGASYACLMDFAQCLARHSDDSDEKPSDDGFRVVFATRL